MSFSEIEQIRGCRSLQKLQNLWQSNVKEWSKLPADQAKELIRVKDECKERLYCFEERTAIMEFDGGLSREEAETLAREEVGACGS